MRTVNRAAYWIVAVAVVLGTFWLGYVRRPVETRAKELPVPVEVEPVGTGAIEQTVELTGVVTANKRVDVASKVAGRIESLSATMPDGSQTPVDVGLCVTQGQPLAIIDHDVHQAQVAAAEAEVRARQVELEQAQRENKRIVALLEGGSATEQSKDQAATALDLAVTQLNLARANLELAQINLRESTIVSPIDGIVTARFIDEGNLVAQGQRIISVADIRTAKVLAAVPERYASRLCQELPATLTVDAYKDRVFETKVHCVYPALDEQTHTLRVEIRMPNDAMTLRPGMFARVKLILARKDAAVVIPRDAVLGGQIDSPYVYVVENGRAKKRGVETGLTQGDRCEIAGGLQAGESLIVNGMHRLADGAAIEVVRLEDIQ